MMRAIQYQKFGGYEELGLVEVPVPRPEPGQALVRMRLASVTPLDNTVREGHLPASVVKPFPIVPGTNGVGEIVEAGATGLRESSPVLVGGWGLGTRRDGTWREYIAAAPADLLSIPDGLSAEAVAALSAGAGHLTAYMALTELVPFAAGQTVLAPGIGGSVGQGAMEVARVLGASAAISTASTTAKAELGRAAGFDVIDLSSESLRDGVARRTEGRGVDVVLDGVAGPFTGDALASLAPGGTLVSVGYSGGMKTTINVTDIIWRSARVVGFMFPMFAPAAIAEANQALFDLLARKKLRPVVARTFPLAEAAEAQRHLIVDRPYGRVLLRF
jgi:NADPH:quinone reductase